MNTKKFEFEYKVYDDISELDKSDIFLLTKARSVTSKAYAPYSNFVVGAAAILENGETVVGTNQENAAYPDGMCAERVALFAKASQYPEDTIKMIVVVAKSDNVEGLVPATCCGSCRQVMLEFELRQDKTYEVIMQGDKRQWITAPSAQSLLPFSFTKKNLLI